MTESDADDIRDANTSPLLRERSEETSTPETPRPDLRGIRAVYFDLDDTLCGYWDASKLALHQTFVQHAPEGRTPEEMVQAWATAFRSFAPNLKKTGWYAGYLLKGEPTRTEQMRRTLAEIGIVDEERAQALSETYMRLRDGNLRLFSDALEVLTDLKARYPLGLITNGPADIQRQEIATLGIESFFDHFFIEGELGEGKPKPAVFERATQAMGCAPEEILMVGNSFAHDVVPALAAGWHAIWIRRASDVPPSATHPEIPPEGAPIPDAVVGSLTEVRALLP
jgi:putative hydrolase of the HAD superfamily